MNNVESTYESLIDFFKKIVIDSNNKELTDLAKASYMTYAKALCNLKNININDFVERINKIVETKKINFKYTSNKEIDEYILNTIYKSENNKLKDKFQELVDKLIIDLKNPNDLLITTWINNYNAFVDQNNKILDKEKMTEYIDILFKKYDKSGKYSNNIKKYINTETIEKNKSIENPVKVEKKVDITEEKIDKPLKIKNIKKSNLKPATLKNIKRFSLIGIAATLGLGTGLMTYIIYKSFNKKGALDKKMTDLLRKFGYETKNNDEIIVNKEEAEKEKYSFIKNKLMETNNKKDEGTIKKDYKKNKLASILLNSKIVKTLRNYKRKQDKPIINNDNELMYKGLGKC